MHRPDIAIYSYYLTWLMQIAYTDYRTGYVYSRMTLTGLIPLICSIVLLGSCDIFSVSGCIVSDGMLILIVYLMGRISCIGAGDVDILIIGVCFNSVYYVLKGIRGIYNLVMCNICYVYGALLLFIIIHISKINWKKLRLDRNRPFVPCIYAASLILGVIIFTIHG